VSSEEIQSILKFLHHAWKGTIRRTPENRSRIDELLMRTFMLEFQNTNLDGVTAVAPRLAAPGIW
jgi:hypothetical protein